MSTHPVAPDLIPDFPKLHSERRRGTISRAHRAILRSHWSVTIFDPLRRFFDSRAAAFNVHRDRRLGPRGARERNEFIGAEVARLGFILPRQVDPRYTLVARPDAPHPAIVLRDIATGPANESRIELFDLFENVATHTAGRSVTGHQRNLIDPNSTFAGKEDREARERITAPGFQCELILPPLAFRYAIDAGSRVGLAEVYVRFERDGNGPVVIRCPGPDVTSVLDALTDRNARLINSVT